MINQKSTAEQLLKEIDLKSNQCVQLKECLGMHNGKSRILLFTLDNGNVCYH